jgi:hypothetical protein
MLVKDLSKRVKIVVNGKVLPSAVVVSGDSEAASEKPEQASQRR